MIFSGNLQSTGKGPVGFIYKLKMEKSVMGSMTDQVRVTTTNEEVLTLAFSSDIVVFTFRLLGRETPLRICVDTPAESLPTSKLLWLV